MQKSKMGKLAYYTVLFIVTGYFYSSLILLALLQLARYIKLPVRGMMSKITYFSKILILFFIHRLKIQYQIDEIPKHNNSLLIVSNHQSLYETLFFQNYFKPTSHILKKQLSPLGKFSDDAWESVCYAPIISLSRTQKRKDITKIFKLAPLIFDKGIKLVVYPEGTRVIAGEYKQMSNIFATLAHKNKIDVLAVCHNFGAVFDNKHRRVNFKQKLYIKNKLFKQEEFKDAKQLAEEVTRWLQNEITELLSDEHKKNRQKIIEHNQL